MPESLPLAPGDWGPLNDYLQGVGRSVLSYGAVGDGVADDTGAVQQAVNAASGGGTVVFPPGRYAINKSIVLNNSIVLRFHDNKTVVEQKSWGVPAFEIRADDVTILGGVACEYTGSRTLFDSTALTNSNNSALVKSECAGDPKNAGSAIYCRTTYDRLYIQRLRVKGFINGFFVGLSAASDWQIDSAVVDTVDFGLFGLPGIDGSVGALHAKNLTQTQGVAEHAIYWVQGSRSRGFTADSVSVNGIATRTSHAVAIKTVDDFSIGHLAVTGAGTLFTTTDAKGSIGALHARSLTAVLDTDAVALVDIQTSSIIGIDNCDIEANVSGTSSASYSQVFSCSTSSELTTHAPRVRMIHATPGAVLRCSALAWCREPRIVYDNAPASGLAAFMLAGTKSATVCQYINRPHLRGTDQLIRPESGADSYEAEVDPNWINGGVPSDTTVVSGTANHHNRVVVPLEGEIALALNSATPRIRCPVDRWKTNSSGATTITQFQNGTNGQIFSIRAVDANTTIQNNANIHMIGAVNLTLANNQMVWFEYRNGIVYEIATTP